MTTPLTFEFGFSAAQAMRGKTLAAGIAESASLPI
jgi:hypothetical protein